MSANLIIKIPACQALINNTPSTTNKGSKMNDKFDNFFKNHPDCPTPYNVFDVDGAIGSYHDFVKHMPNFNVFYAVKCNSQPELLKKLAIAGASFDCASIEEINLVLSCGAKSANISFGNTVKKAQAISEAHKLGVKLFAFDSEAEARKIAQHAPNSEVFVRILYEGLQSAWPLSRKFGCSQNLAIDLMVLAKSLGLKPRGVSFHVGSQMHDPKAWNHPISVASKIFDELEKMGIICDLLNCGGGFPGDYLDATPKIADYGKAISQSIHEYFGNKKLFKIVEPGRGIVSNHAKVVSEIVLISKKYKSDSMRWIYIDAGIYNGLFDALGEGIKYKITKLNNNEIVENSEKASDNELAILAGPTCDSVDTLYEKNPYELPLSLKIGDRLVFHNVGAYSRNVSSCSFNGFEPLKVYVI